MKSQIEKTREVLNQGSDAIFSEVKNSATNCKKYDNLIGQTIIELVAKVAKGEVAEIASKYEDEINYNPTNKEAQLIVNEVTSNKAKYLSELESHADECKDDALEVLREIYPGKSDAELRKMIG